MLFRSEIEKRIIGQRRVIEQLLVALFARGHTLFVGVPGLAKTLLISTLAETLNLSFQRIQFTPDLMPADITGTEVLEEDHTTGRRIFRMAPLHHHFQKLGWKESKVVTRFYIAGILCAVVALSTLKIR